MSILYEWIMEHIDILSLIIDFLSFVVAIVLTIAIYALERKHEKDHEKAEEKAQKLAVKEAARVFLIDNDEELEYLPLAEIAAKLKLKRKHCRQLTTRYLRCSKQQQDEVLHQANIPNIQVSMDKVKTALSLLQADLDKNGFGRNILYDDAKYLHRAFERWADVKIEDVNPSIFANLRISEWHRNQTKLPRRVSECDATLYSYMWDYMHTEEFNVKKSDVAPPIDMVFQQCNLGTCGESIMTFWTMRIVIDACHTFKYEQYDNFFDESLIQTQEDMYYYALAVLCNAYLPGGADKNEQT